MTTVLQIEASARGSRSLSRELSQRFEDEWRIQEPEARFIRRDVGRYPPPLITEEWISAAFTPPEKRSAGQKAVLQVSDELIGEVEAADVIAIASPMYNYGMPAALKAWFDQVIRVGRTFSFDLARGDWPLEPLLSGKTLVVLSSRGEFGFEAGGIRRHMNHLDTHIDTCAHYLGVARKHFVAIDYQEFGDERHQRSIARAREAVRVLVGQLTAARTVGVVNS
jgi:FMN-dependent NADH-azoreductase